MSDAFEKLLKEAKEKKANLLYIKEKLTRLFDYNVYNDVHFVRRRTYEIDEELKRIDNVTAAYHAAFESVGAFTEEVATKVIRSLRAVVVYYELLYERAARWDQSPWSYQYTLNYESVLGKYCTTSDRSYVRLFSQVAYEDETAIDKVLKAEAEYVAKEAVDNAKYYRYVDYYLPYEL